MKIHHTSVIISILAVFLAVILPAQCQSLAEYVPEDALFFIEVRDLGDAWSGITSSNSWKAFLSMKAVRDFRFENRIEHFQTAFKDATGIALDRTNIMSLLGKQFVIAICAKPGDSNGEVMMEAVLVSRCSSRKPVEDMLETLMTSAKENLGGDAAFTTLVHNGVKINTITPRALDQTTELRYGFDKDVLIFGVGNLRPRIETYIDCSVQKASSLERLQQFNIVRTIIEPMRGNSLVTMYIDAAGIRKLTQSVEEGNHDVLGAIDRLCSAIGFGSAIGMSATIDEGVRMKTLVLPNDKPGELEKLALGVKPAEGAARNYIPKDTVACFAASSLPDPLKAYDLVMKEWQASPTQSFMAQFIEQIELSLDIEVRKDVLPVIGPETAFIFGGFDQKRYLFPMPRVAWLIRVKDRPAADELIAKLKRAVQESVPEGSFEVAFKTETHEGVRISFIEVPNFVEPGGPPLDPCFAFADDFLIIGTSRAYVKTMIDVSKGREKSLIDTSPFRLAAIPTEVNHFTFINWESFDDQIRQGLKWAITYADRSGMGDDAREKINNYVAPLLRLLSAVKSYSSYTIITPRGCETISHIRLEDLPGI